MNKLVKYGMIYSIANLEGVEGDAGGSSIGANCSASSVLVSFLELEDLSGWEALSSLEELRA